MRVSPQGYLTEGMSTYDVRLGCRHQFVLLNNSLAAEFIKQNRSGEDDFYLLTAALEAELHSLRSL